MDYKEKWGSNSYKLKRIIQAHGVLIDSKRENGSGIFSFHYQEAESETWIIL
jgi:hypothetical protein